MALSDAQWAEGLADVVDRLIAGTINADQAAAEITALTADWPTRTMSNADLAQRVSRFLARLNGLILTEGPPPLELGELNTFAYDTVNGALYGPKTVTGWGNPVSLIGPAGPTLELQKTADYVQWRVVGADDWLNLVPLADLAGADGREIELGVSETHIRTRLGDGEWVDLIPIATLRGADGREVSLRRSGDALQWRLGGGEWVDLIPVADLKGDPGAGGWSPLFAAVVDGERRVMRLVDWIGGEGAKPPTGKYVGPTGLVDMAAAATDFRGAGGSGAGDMVAAQNLNDLTNKAEARTNLVVYSRAEVDQMLTDLIDQAALDAAVQALEGGLSAISESLGDKVSEQALIDLSATIQNQLDDQQAQLDLKLGDDARGAANGVAPLGADSKIDPSYLPAPETGGGLVLIGEITAPFFGATIVEFANIPDGFKSLTLEVIAATHNNGTQTQWVVRLQQRSDDALAIVATSPNIANSAFLTGRVSLLGASANLMSVSTGFATAAGAVGGGPSGNVSQETVQLGHAALTGGCKGVRIGPSAGAIAGGTFRLYGAK